MTHKFSIEGTIEGVSLEIVQSQMSKPEFHERVAKKIPGTQLKILRSVQNGSMYTLQRSYNLDVNIPDIAKKFLKNAFRLEREDQWNTSTLTAESKFTMNMPSEFKSTTKIDVLNGIALINQHWIIEVRVPLIHGILARHAEAEIRKFHQIEMDIIKEELKNI